jgi:2-polyprenyl-3-methyl-5-hydroxy-6-metoxy-1,4-benzoquinol methylase
MDVLDIACAQGDIALDIAPYCCSVVGYDRMAAWINLAQGTAQERCLTNTTFIHHDSSAEANDGRIHLPTPAGTYDLLICSKGPFHWIEDARRIARPGAVHAGPRCHTTYDLDNPSSLTPALPRKRP